MISVFDNERDNDIEREFNFYNPIIKEMIKYFDLENIENTVEYYGPGCLYGWFKILDDEDICELDGLNENDIRIFNELKLKKNHKIDAYFIFDNCHTVKYLFFNRSFDCHYFADDYDQYIINGYKDGRMITNYSDHVITIVRCGLKYYEKVETDMLIKYN